MAKIREEKNATHIYTDFNMKVTFTDDREGLQGSIGAFILNNEGAVELDERIRSIKRRAVKAMQKAVDEFNANDKNRSVVAVKHNHRISSRPFFTKNKKWMWEL
tara:strand:+ start:4781 stop:5092 length:312 start_codon:yes stop_codon:yes gene_type:complete